MPLYREKKHFSPQGIVQNTPDSNVHGANMGPIWGRQDPGGPHVGPMNFAIWDRFSVYDGRRVSQVPPDILLYRIIIFSGVTKLNKRP